jgi:hypothetical protein
MLYLDPLAYDACCLRRADDGAKSFLGMLLHACLVLSGRFLDHLRVGRERARKGGKTVNTVTLAPIRLAKAMPCWTAFSASSDPRIRVPLLTLRPTRSDAHVSTLKIRWVLLRVL